LLLGGLAACSDDDGDDDGGTDTEQDSGDGGGDTGTESGNADVQAYCDDAEALVEEFESVEDAADLGTLTEESTALSQAAAELGTDLSAEDAEAVGECTQAIGTAAADAATRVTN
jgi:hypothetical protein